MADQPSEHQDDDFRTLRFACACASSAPVATDPWVAVAQQGKLADGTKERILNALARQPLSLTELAQRLGLSPPAIHRHLTALVASELVQEVPIPAAARRSPTERHYRPAFPIIRAADRQVLDPVVEALAAALAAVVQEQQVELAAAFARTELAAHGVPFAALRHYLYASATRRAREQLETAGTLPPWPTHGDGSRWVWWAEAPAQEPRETEVA
jgi:DNA-binding transcriptional ArsR family regulator